MTSTTREDQDTETPHASKKPAVPGKPDQLKDSDHGAEDRQDALLDEGIDETFPASDPVSVKKIT